MSKIITNSPIDGPRSCKKSELPEVIALIDAEMRENTDQSMLTDYPFVYENCNLNNIQILKVDNELASVVPFVPQEIAINGCRFWIGIISPTATAIKHRKKGYAISCLNNCIERMNNCNIDLSVLWTLEKTFPFYEKAKYQAVRSQAWIYRCTKDYAARFADCPQEITEYDPANNKYPEEIFAIYKSEENGVLRNIERLEMLLSLPKVRTLIALKNEKVAAYLTVSKAFNKPGILEGKGEKKHLEGLIGKTLLTLNEDEHIDAHVNFGQSVLRKLFEEKMPERKTAFEGGHMMIRINDAISFFSKIKDVLVKKNGDANHKFSFKITDTGETISFEFENNSLKIDQANVEPHINVSLQELTSIVFDPHPARPAATPDFLSTLFPIYFPIPMLDHS